MTTQSRLASIRRYHNISQRRMANLINVDVKTYMNKENGLTQFKMNEMFTISKKFGKPIEQIFLPENFMSHEMDEAK